MYESIDDLHDTFVAHEHLAPQADDVLARVDVIAKRLRRRRWAVRATGASVLGAGLVAGGIALPGLASSGGNQRVATIGFADGGDASASPTPTPSPTASYSQEQELAKYFSAGYDYNDALALQKAWNSSADIATIKAEAGLDLLEGQQLPVTPHDPNDPSGGGSDAQAIAQSEDVTLFFDDGYTYNDAVTIGNAWNTSDTYQVKIDAGKKLLAGDSLPIPPSGTPVSETQKDEDFFIAAGYDYSDAQQLATMWHETDITQVKAEAGKKLLDGETLPISP